MIEILAVAIDPNVIITAITTVLGFFFGKRRGKAQEKKEQTDRDNPPRKP